MELSFRAATMDDLERMLEIHLAAYPDPRGVEERRRHLTANPLGGLDRLVVAERAGEIVGQAFLFELETWFGGRPVKTGGVASVAVAPEARQEGVAGALLRHLHAAADVRGDALTMLYAFRQGFYATHGYAQAASRKRLELDPRSIPEGWRRGGLRRARGEDRGAILRIYERAAASASGWLVRPEALWDRRFARERRQWLVLDGNGRGGGPSELAGYVSFELGHDEPHAPTRLHVSEIVAEDDASRRALWGALGALRDQVAEISVEVDAADPLELALIDADRRRSGALGPAPSAPGNDLGVEHPLGVIVGGPMVRIEDVPRAIESRGYAAGGAFDVVVDDEMAVSVRVEDGRASVSSAMGGGAIRTSRRALAAMLYGSVRPSDASRLGIVDADARTLAKVDAILAMPPVAPLDPF